METIRIVIDGATYQDRLVYAHYIKTMVSSLRQESSDESEKENKSSADISVSVEIDDGIFLILDPSREIEPVDNPAESNEAADSGADTENPVLFKRTCRWLLINYETLKNGTAGKNGLQERNNLLFRTSCILIGNSPETLDLFNSIADGAFTVFGNFTTEDIIAHYPHEVSGFCREHYLDFYNRVSSNGVWPSRWFLHHTMWNNGSRHQFNLWLSLAGIVSSGTGHALPPVIREHMEKLYMDRARAAIEQRSATIAVYGDAHVTELYSSIAETVLERWNHRYESITVKELPSLNPDLYRMVKVISTSGKKMHLRISFAGGKSMETGTLATALGNTSRIVILWLVPAAWLDMENHGGSLDTPLEYQLIELMETVDALHRSNNDLQVTVHLFVADESERSWPSIDCLNDEITESAVARNNTHLYYKMKMIDCDIRFHRLCLDRARRCLSCCPQWLDLILEEAVGTVEFVGSKTYRSASRAAVTVPD